MDLLALESSNDYAEARPCNTHMFVGNTVRNVCTVRGTHLLSQIETIRLALLRIYNGYVIFRIVCGDSRPSSSANAAFTS